MIVRERGGNSFPAAFDTESAAASFIRSRVAKGTLVRADEATLWDGLPGAASKMKRINHLEAYSVDGARTNQAEFFLAFAPSQRLAFIATSLALMRSLRQ